MGLIRLIIFGFIGLSIIYALVWIYSRSVRREKLENAWAEEHPQGGEEAARDAYIEKGMKDYHASLRPKLLLLIYVVPAILVAAAFYMTN